MFLAFDKFVTSCKKFEIAIIAATQTRKRRSVNMEKHIVAVFAALLALGACAAKVHEWPHLPPGSMPDTEVSTNVVLHVNAERLESFGLSIQAEGGATSEVLVAVGHDADCDGDLSFEETAFVFGRDCGSGYLVNYSTESALYDMGDSITIARSDFDPAWNLAKVVKRGAGAIGETITETVENQQFSIHVR